MELLSKPVLKTSVRSIWTAFWTLSHSRQLGYASSQPIAMSEIKAYYELFEESQVEVEMSEARIANNLCTFYPTPIVEAHAHLQHEFQRRSIPRGSDVSCEVKVVHTNFKLTPWQRKRRFVDAIQRMDKVFLDYERSKQQ